MLIGLNMTVDKLPNLQGTCGRQLRFPKMRAGFPSPFSAAVPEKIGKLVCRLMSSVQETLARFADDQRPSKRQRVDEMSDSDIDSNNDASKSDSNTLLKKREKSSPTWELKDDLLDTIANNLNADEQTNQDVSDKLAKLVNKRWSEKLTSNKLTGKLKKHS